MIDYVVVARETRTREARVRIKASDPEGAIRAARSLAAFNGLAWGPAHLDATEFEVVGPDHADQESA